MAGNPFTSAQAPAAMQMLAPDIATQQTQLTRQQQLADMLRNQALAPDGGTQVINGWAVRKSPLEGVSKMAQALMGGYIQNNADEKQMALSKALQGRMGDILGSGNGSDPASAALTQGAAEQPSQADETGALVNQGGVGPTVQNAARMDAMPAPQPNNFNMANLLKGQVIGDLGGQAAGAAYWDQFKPTEGMKSDKYLGITPEQSRTSELAKRLKEGYIAPTRLGEGAYADSNGNVQGLPTAAPAGFINARGPDGQWTTVPVTGGLDAVQESTRATTLGKTLGTLGQGFDDQNRPTYFLGLPPGTVNAPQGGSSNPAGRQPVLPGSNMLSRAQPGAQSAPSSSAPMDLNNMSQPERDKVMAGARAQFGLQPGSAPGSSVQGPSAAATAAPLPQPTIIRPGNAPGQNEYMQTTATAAGKRTNDLVSTAADSPTRVNVLDNIISLSKSGVASGPNAEWINKVKGTMEGVPGFTGWKDDVTGYQELKKYMAQNGIRAWQAAGGSGTDAQLSAAMAANPNEKMNPKAVQAMANWTKAGEIALQGKANAAQSAGIATPQDQAKFEATWRQNMDPRIYQMRVMEPAEANAFVTNLKKTDPTGYATLLKKAQILKQMGGL